MLLAHNFALPEGELHSLNREEFADVFIQGLAEEEGVSCQLIDNPHWIVEVTYDTQKYVPADMGKKCTDTLAAYRKSRDKKDFTIMALGGVKNTPASSPSPSLQTGEWGVDVVETGDPKEFLEEINWEKLSSAKPAEDIFRVDCAL